MKPCLLCLYQICVCRNSLIPLMMWFDIRMKNIYHTFWNRTVLLSKNNRICVYMYYITYYLRYTTDERSISCVENAYIDWIWLLNDKRMWQWFLKTIVVMLFSLTLFLFIYLFIYLFSFYLIYLSYLFIFFNFFLSYHFCTKRTQNVIFTLKWHYLPVRYKVWHVWKTG